MLEFCKKLLGGNEAEMEQIRTVIANGAVIIDVRTQGEFRRGNINGSKNIPVDDIGSNVKKIEAMKKPIVLCCASGMRSARAASILKANGIADVYDAGSWVNLQ